MALLLAIAVWALGAGGPRRAAVLAATLAGVAWSALAVGFWRGQGPSGPSIVTIEGVVTDFPRRFVNSVRIDLALDASSTGGAITAEPSARGVVRVSCYRCRHRFTIGSRWRLRVRLRPLTGLANPGGFDYERWAFQRRIVARGSLIDDAVNVRIADPGRHPLSPYWRQRVRDFHLERLQPGAGSAIVSAITLGDRARLGDETREIFSRTGTRHLVAISGLHVGMVFLVFFAVGNLAVRLVPPLVARRPARKLAAVLALPPTLYYAWFAGLSLPTLRAAAMLVVFYLAYLLDRRMLDWYSFAVALLAVILIDPLAPLSSGFWLSFGAVAAIVHHHRVGAPSAMPGSRIGRKLVGWGRLQLAVSKVMIPASLVGFGVLSPVSVPANLVAIPFFSMVVVPPALAGTAAVLAGADPLAAALLGVSVTAAEFMQSMLQWAQSIPGAWFAPVGPVAVALVLAAVTLTGFRGGIRRRLAAVIALSVLAGGTGAPRPSPGSFELMVLDVGQGLAAVVRTRHHALVYDAGIRLSPGYDMGRMAVLPYLRHLGASRVDRVVQSHGDRDHAGGIASVLADHPQALFMSSERGRSGPGIPCVAGMAWHWDGVRFEVLSPSDISRRRHNNRSCVLHISGRFGAALLPGDIEDPAERHLVARFGDALRAEVLVVPHHGSATSTTNRLLALVEPVIAVVPRGRSNPFGHPAPEVVERLTKSGTRVFDTAVHGAVRVSVNAAGIDATPFRGLHRRPWSRAPVPLR